MVPHHPGHVGDVRCCIALVSRPCDLSWVPAGMSIIEGRLRLGQFDPGQLNRVPRLLSDYVASDCQRALEFREPRAPEASRSLRVAGSEPV